MVGYGPILIEVTDNKPLNYRRLQPCLHCVQGKPTHSARKPIFITVATYCWVASYNAWRVLFFCH